MIIFSSPKPFRPDTEPVQRSAIRSWKAAFPKAEIFLFGKEQGLVAICREEGLEHGGTLQSHEGGGEVITPMFQQMAERFPGQPMLYLNSDIFLEPAVKETLRPLSEKEGPWIATTRRWCVPRFEGPAIDSGQWKNFWLRTSVEGEYGDACALDLFLIRDFSLKEMPPFLIGHAGWDNWMIFHARMRGIPVIDLSAEIAAIHCEHDYAYARQNTRQDRRDGPLEDHNLRLLGPESHRFHLGHATHEFREGQLAKKRGWATRQRNFELWRIRHPEHDWWVRILKSVFRPLFRLWEKQTTRTEGWSSKKRKTLFYSKSIL